MPPRIPPTPVVKATFGLRARLRRAADAVLPPQGVTFERTLLIAEAKLLAALCELGVPEAIDAGATQPQVIAQRVDGHADSLDRALRFLASRGWFTRRRGGYRLNRRSRALRAADEESLRDWVRFMGSDWAWDVWNHVGVALRTGGSPARAALGKPLFDWFHDDRPDAGAVFDGAMRSTSGVAGPLVARALDLTGVCTLCDVGGGTGGLLRALLEANPQLTGTVFDLPEVVEGVPEVMAGLPADRWQAVGGSFFAPDAVPAGHDRYVLQAIVHDWGDDAAGAILRHVRAAMGDDPAARVHLVDSILVPEERDDLSKAVDVLMLALTEGGRERTRPEWARLFADSGFRIESQTQLPLLIWVSTLARTG